MALAAAVSGPASRRTGRQCRPVMFTLCMSRGPHRDSNNRNILNKQIKGGYLLRYKRGFFCKGWSEEWVVLYEDSTIAWFADKGLSRPRGWVRIGEAPELLAVGEWTRQVPRRPRIPQTCQIGQLLAIGAGKSPHDAVHWLMAQSPSELNDWMTAISNTLPPPTHPPIVKRLSLTSGHPHHQHQPHAHQQHVSSIRSADMIAGKGENSQNPAHGADHTALSGLAIDWGHGWGWGQTAWEAQSACAHGVVTANSAAFYCHTDDYAIGGYEEVDWSAFGDFSF